MKTHQVSFGTVHFHDDGIVEVIADEGVEVTQKETDEFHRLLEETVSRTCGILINRKHKVSHTFEAMQEIGTSPRITAIAILTYSDTSKLAAESLKAVARRNCEIETFTSKPGALQWLHHQLSKKPGISVISSNSGL